MTTATITRIQEKESTSRYKGNYYVVYFKSSEGKFCYSYIYPKMQNFKRWSKVLTKGITLTGLSFL